MTTNNHLPQPPNTSEYTFRPARREDAPAIFQMMLDIDVHDNRTWAGTLADTEKEFDDPNVNVETDTLAAFTADGQVAALAWLYAPPEPGEEHLVFLWNNFHPDHRANDLADAIMDWAEARGRQILAERPRDRPHVLRISCMAHNAYRKELHTRHGFEPVRYFFEMRRDLSEPIAAVALPPGIVIRPWEPELDQRTYEAFEEAFQDHWGQAPVSKDVWDMFMVGRESFRPDLSFVILDGEEVAGFTLNYLSPEENKRNGIQEAWVGDLGVRRRWRKRGFATALLNQSMRAFAAEGMDYASLGV
ncbi:MAG TPA: GNAT family N-acetyltransferase, partial [Caldilineae bacterium]|nr:GNAT family N-acetyltransferase [Caldilineae bacterium]